ncbi:T7SS effector LXG polymorphic toxin [Priestia megaterium]|uniref:T7SS effector LXG polymorphic toxin n=1 Tax=Priestia megaterium TaxID=1404 RepID=UPI003CC04B13
MKTLDVDAFHENIQAILDSIKSQKEQIQGLISQVQAFSGLDDAFKGKGGEAIRSFYETGHASFLTLYHSLLTSYEARLTQITHALRSFEPSEDGYITQPFLQDTIPAHLNQTRNTTVSLVDQANAAIQKVSHLASVSALNDQGFLTEVEQAKNKADKTMNDLVRFDEQQTQSLSSIQDQLTSLNSLLSKVKAGFQNGSIQPGNVSELSALAKKAMTDSGGVSVFEKGIQTTLTRKEKQEKVIKEVGLEKLIQLQAMTPAEQLKEIHRLEKTSPYIREVLTQIQQDTAPANMKKLAELSPAEQAVELEKSPYLQALNDSSTVGMLTSQQVLQNATGVEGMLMQSVMSQGQIRSVGTKKTAESFDFTEICENPKAKKEETGIKAVVKDVGEGAVTLAKGTVTGTKGVAQDIWAGMGERADKRYNSLYDFGNYITMGGFDGAVSFKEGLNERGAKSFDSPYDFVNHATMGLLDVGQQALNPEKPLSKEHWENSMFLFASVIGGAKPAGALKSVPKVTNVPRVPAHKATKTLSDMRNVVSPKAASNWSKKVYEPVQKPSKTWFKSLNKKYNNILNLEIRLQGFQNEFAVLGPNLIQKNFRETFQEMAESYKIKALKPESKPIRNGVSVTDYDQLKDQLKQRYKKFVQKKQENISQTSHKLLPNELQHDKYGRLPNQVGDNITGHHMPSNKFMKDEFDINMRESYAMFLEQPHPGTGGRHRRTFTYGLSKHTRPEDYNLYMSLKPRDALAFDINDLRRILKEDDLYNQMSRRQLRGYISYYKNYVNSERQIFKK